MTSTLFNQAEKLLIMLDGIRFALTEDERRASYRLRYKIYVESMGRLKEKGNHMLKELRDQYDEVARTVIAIKNGEPIGTLRVFWGGDITFSNSMKEVYPLDLFLQRLSEKDICVIERLMVEEHHRGSATALRLYREVMKFVLDHKVEAVLIDCEPHHMNSYLKLGFRPCAETYNYPGIGSVVPMVLITGDFMYLKEVGSPFTKLITKEDVGYCRRVDELRTLVKCKSRNVDFSMLYRNRIKTVNNVDNLNNKKMAARFKMRLSA
ncbi:GNAT family N-acetyltransferase [Methylomarinum sp. Ch1-1]|uniref:GNAT family N-acetyltransferase n=1 Tax=Methylomarinum roseum TaxID=3067653 RepID=A0AAU7NPG9_9GAMM|nr:GNAT family N-acetyltransferase [Methylomarinum sp. Ch1-1]MDP4521243.1 GNAT family N-acetyltransferase [Methylomarinum sp. Ch1-1]